MDYKVKLTRRELMNIMSVLNSLNGSYSVKMKYAIKKNKDLLKNEVEAVEEASQTNSKRYKEYDEKRMKKIEEYAERENGKIKLLPDNRSVKIKEDKLDDFNAAILLLQEEYKEGIEEREKEVKEFDNFIKEEIEVEVFKISNDIIPNDISQGAYEVLFPLIKDE